MEIHKGTVHLVSTWWCAVSSASCSQRGELSEAIVSQP